MLDFTAFLLSAFLIFLGVLLLRTVVEDYVRTHSLRAARREALHAQDRGIWLPSEQIEFLQIRLRQHGEQRRQADNPEGQRDHRAVSAAARS